MLYAGYNSPYGESLTASGFEKKAGINHKENNIFPYCFACQKIVFTRGTTSPNINDHYVHYTYDDSVDPMDYCIESNAGKNNKYLKGLFTDGWTLENGILLRNEFFKEDNIKRAYIFCLKLCGTGNFPLSTFERVIKRADAKNIWSYKNIPVWVIPYILLLLTDFHESKKDYQFRFILNKPSKLPLQNLWIKNEYNINKIFSDSGADVRYGSKSIDIDTYLDLSKDTAWLTDSFVNRLLELE